MIDASFGNSATFNFELTCSGGSGERTEDQFQILVRQSSGRRKC